MMNFINKFQRTYDPPNPNGRAAAAASAPVVLSNEDKAVLDAQTTALQDCYIELGYIYLELSYQSGIDYATSAKQDTQITILGGIENTVGNIDVTTTDILNYTINTDANIGFIRTQQTDGTQKAVVRGGVKGATTAADVTSTNQSATRQALDVQIRTSAGVAVDTFGGGSQYPELDTTSPATGTVFLGRYKTADVTLTDGQLYNPQLNIKGEQRVFNKPWKTNGTLTVAGGANQTLTLDVEGMSVLVVQTTTAWAGSGLTLQGSVDGSTWITVAGTNINAFFNVNGGSQSQTITANTLGIFRCNVSGFTKARIINLSTITSGVVTLYMLATNAVSNNVTIEGNNAASNVLQVNLQGTGGGFYLKTEDSASASGDIGITVFGIRRDGVPNSASLQTSANGDYGELATSKYGGLYVKDEEKRKRTYSIGFSVAAAASATDIFAITGSASKTLSIQSILISGVQTTAGMVQVSIVKRSTANSGGTSTSAVFGSHDSADAAASGTALIYTANPTTGTLVATLKTFNLAVPQATGTSDTTKEINFGVRGKPVLLLSATESLCINLNGNTVIGGTFYISLEVNEE